MDNNFKTVDNPQINSAYSFGLIQSIKLTLQRMLQVIAAEKNPDAVKTEQAFFYSFLEWYNEMPTVAECGKFELDPEQPLNKEVVFIWIPAVREQMLDLLN